MPLVAMRANEVMKATINATTHNQKTIRYKAARQKKTAPATEQPVC